MEGNQERVVREAVSKLYEIRRNLEKDIPNSRERSLSITKIDEAAMWIKQIPVKID